MINIQQSKYSNDIHKDDKYQFLACPSTLNFFGKFWVGALLDGSQNPLGG
jgi:hypothetical protein